MMRFFKRSIGATLAIASLAFAQLKGFIELLELPEAAYRALFERLPNAVAWLLTTPWWVPATLSVLSIGIICWSFWPDYRAEEELKKVKGALIQCEKRCGELASEVEALAHQVDGFPLMVSDLKRNFSDVLDERLAGVTRASEHARQTADSLASRFASMQPDGDLRDRVIFMQERIDALDAALHRTGRPEQP